MTYIMREGVFVCLLLIEYGLSSVWFLTLPYVMWNVAQAKVVLGMGFLYSSPRFLIYKNRTLQKIDFTIIKWNSPLDVGCRTADRKFKNKNKHKSSIPHMRTLKGEFHFMIEIMFTDLYFLQQHLSRVSSSCPERFKLQALDAVIRTKLLYGL